VIFFPASGKLILISAGALFSENNPIDPTPCRDFSNPFFSLGRKTKCAKAVRICVFTAVNLPVLLPATDGPSTDLSGAAQVFYW